MLIFYSQPNSLQFTDSFKRTLLCFPFDVKMTKSTSSFCEHYVVAAGRRGGEDGSNPSAPASFASIDEPIYNPVLVSVQRHRSTTVFGSFSFATSSSLGYLQFTWEPPNKKKNAFTLERNRTMVQFGRRTISWLFGWENSPDQAR